MLDIEDIKTHLSVSKEHNYVVLDGFPVCKNVMLKVSIETGYRLLFSFEDARFGDIGIWYEYTFRSLETLASMHDAILDWAALFRNCSYRDIDEYFHTFGTFKPVGFMAFRSSTYLEHVFKETAG